jgi:phage FluMu protein Com
MVEAEGEAPKSGVRKTTVGEQGPNLPLGFLDASGAHTKQLDVKTWTMVEEKLLAKLKEDGGENLTVGRHVSGVLATMFNRLGHYDFGGDMKPAEKQIVVSQAFMGDVWYAYVWLRIQAIGSELKVKIRCPKCKNLYDFTGDLNSTEVNVADKLTDLLWDYELHDPIKIYSKQVTKLRMGPARWAMIESHDGTGGDAAAKEVAIRSHVYFLNDEPDQCVLGECAIDAMGKVDIEMLTAKVDERFLGPNMSLETGPENPCPHPRCKSVEVHRIPLDWTYDNFFAISSP